MATINSTAAVFSIPLELLDLILERLDQRSVLSLSFTCKAAASAQLFEKHIYRHLACNDGIPLESLDNFRHYYQTRDRTIINGLNGRTGPMVKTMAVHKHMAIGMLAIIADRCPNLANIDFTAVPESIDFGEWRSMKYKSDRWLHNFHWFIAFRKVPVLFDRLTSVSVKVSWVGDWFAGEDGDPAVTRQGRNFLPQLCEACPRLQHLTLYAQRSDRSRRAPPPSHVSTYLSPSSTGSPAESYYLSCSMSFDSSKDT
ncbi:MAG: hypothetical protein Q9183_004812 [Haloplaca sp. 2 TL-2023]